MRRLIILEPFKFIVIILMLRYFIGVFCNSKNYIYFGHCPTGPSDKFREFYELVDDDNTKIHHDFHGRQRRQLRDDLENWEHATVWPFYFENIYTYISQFSITFLIFMK